jgi:DNA modification methylase
MQVIESTVSDALSASIPPELQNVGDLDTAIPELAKNARMIAAIEAAIRNIHTHHKLFLTDAQNPPSLHDGSVHLVVTSPPYWTLKRYRETEGQLGHVENYEEFLDLLDNVWRWVYRVLAPGGRLVCVVGDVCLSRRKNNGEHTCVPLHSSIQERCRKIGFSNLAPIIWHKIANANYEVAGNSGFLGKPYEPQRRHQKRYRIYPHVA